MAVQQGYGKMAGTDALVFAYDTGDAVNSYKGRPTVNQFLHHGVSGKGSAADNFVTFPNQGTAGFKRLGYGQTFGDYTIKPEDVVYRYDTVDSVACHYHGNTASVPEGVYVVFSFDFYLSPTITVENGSIANVENYGNDALSGGVTGVNASTEKGVWHRRVQVYGPKVGATPGTQAMFLYPGGCSARLSSTPGYILYKNPQVEFVNYTTESPFVQGTRSATEGLLDLTGNASIDLSNVSFDSDGNIDFDGTSDFIETSVITTNSSNITSISWVYLEGWDSPNSTLGLSVDSSSANGGFRVYNTSSDIGVWQRRSDSSGVSSVSGNYRVPKKQWVQVAFVSDNGSGKIYINDHVAASGTFISPGLVNGPAWVSRYSGGDYHLNGKVDNVMLFNRALSEAEIVSNFNRNKKKHLGADSLLDHTSDGGAWIRWWWYTGVGWPGHETEALGHPFGTFDSSSHYGFQRLPEGLDKEQVELLAKDGDGNIYKWDFASPSATAQQVWDSFTLGTQGRWNNAGDAWNPEVIAGSFFNTDQDAWQYRDSEGVVSFMLDDDTCDCKSTLNAGHAMCGSSWNQQYAQPDGAYLRYGVDTLNDGGCRGPVPERTLELFYRLK